MSTWLERLRMILRRSPWRWGVYALAGVVVMVAIALSSQLSIAQSPSRVLFENVRIFDGTSPELSAPSYVLIEDNKIQTISDEPIAVTAVGDLTVIDGNGRTLMPGLSDAHWHFNLALIDPFAFLDPEVSDEEALATVNSNAEIVAEDMLMRGFTSARETGGTVFELKKNIDEGNLLGPRIWASGAPISQTSGHYDYRPLSDIPRTPTSPSPRAERLRMMAVADGVPEVLFQSAWRSPFLPLAS